MSPSPALASSLLATPTGPAQAALSDWGLIRARGADARKFLQGQLTSEMTQWTAGEVRPAGWCSAKGRLLASFVAFSPAQDEVLLLCSADLLAPTLKRLSMFVLRAACKLDDASAERPIQGLVGPAAAIGAPDLADWRWQATAEGAVLIRLPGALGTSRWLRLGTPPAHLAALPSLDPGIWDGLEAASGVPRVLAANVEQFVPQMVNLELVGGVSFQKGCFPGQEVVARSQYRGTLKRRAYLLCADVPVAPGQDVFHSADPGQPAGRVVNAGPLPGGRHAALVELKIAAFDDRTGSLHLAAPDGPALQRAELPYALPVAEAA
jgi:folate-binding protein YgfZ